MLKPLLDGPYEYFCLQTEIREADQVFLKSHPHIHNWSAQFQDFSDTAALCQLMDLVISVDSSVAHLAGALGQPVWLLLAANSDWRWFLERSDSPWYPSARLFRQSPTLPWTAVMEEVHTALQQTFNFHPKKSAEKSSRNPPDAIND
jgi:ADP-heptose:LPS heptosyltransferase